jgi:hypothetical protein
VLPFVWAAVIIMVAVNLIISIGDLRDVRAKVTRLEAEVATLKRKPAPADPHDELVRLREDIDVCHKRATDIWNALGVVARTVPGRARPPRIPDRKRPTHERRTDEPPIPRPAEGPL